MISFFLSSDCRFTQPIRDDLVEWLHAELSWQWFPVLISSPLCWRIYNTSSAVNEAILSWSLMFWTPVGWSWTLLLKNAIKRYPETLTDISAVKACRYTPLTHGFTEVMTHTRLYCVLIGERLTGLFYVTNITVEQWFSITCGIKQTTTRKKPF